METRCSYGKCGTADLCAHELDPDEVFVPVNCSAREVLMVDDEGDMHALLLEIGNLPLSHADEPIPEQPPVTAFLFTSELYADHIRYLLKLGVEVFGAEGFVKALQFNDLAAYLVHITARRGIASS